MTRIARYAAPLPAAEMAHCLLDAGAVIWPGTHFSPSHEGHTRISFAYDMDTLVVGIDRIESALKNLR